MLLCVVLFYLNSTSHYTHTLETFVLYVLFVSFIYKHVFKCFTLKSLSFTPLEYLVNSHQLWVFCKQTQTESKFIWERMPMECFDVFIIFLFKVMWWISRMKCIHRCCHLLNELETETKTEIKTVLNIVLCWNRAIWANQLIWENVTICNWPHLLRLSFSLHRCAKNDDESERNKSRAYVYVSNEIH